MKEILNKKILTHSISVSRWDIYEVQNSFPSGKLLLHMKIFIILPITLKYKIRLYIYPIKTCIICEINVCISIYFSLSLFLALISLTYSYTWGGYLTNDNIQNSDHVGHRMEDLSRPLKA